MASGWSSVASGTSAHALGFTANASGSYALATGSNTLASGAASTAMGNATVASSFGSVVIGRFNFTPAGINATTWVDADPVFIIGNGTSDTARNNAFVVYKNGDIKIKKVQGDISVGVFTAP